MVGGKHRGWTEWFIEHILYGKWREGLPEKAPELQLIIIVLKTEPRAYEWETGRMK
jgi:hypothetical protein